MLLQALGEGLLQAAAYFTARLLLPLISFGRWTVEPLGNFDKPLDAAGSKRLPDGRLMLSQSWAEGAGITIWIVIGVSIAAGYWTWTLTMAR